MAVEFLIFVSQQDAAKPDVIRILQELAMYQMTVDFMWNFLKIKFGKPRIFDDHGILQEF